jgi:hypothetical protein
MASWEAVCEILAELPAVEIAAPGAERVARVKGALLAPKRLVREFLDT